MERRSFLQALGAMLAAPFVSAKTAEAAAAALTEVPNEVVEPEPLPEVAVELPDLDFRATRVSFTVPPGSWIAQALVPDRTIVIEGMRLEGAPGVLVTAITIAGLPIQIGNAGAAIGLFEAPCSDPAIGQEIKALPSGVSAVGQGRYLLRGQRIEVIVENKTDVDQIVVWWLFHSTLGDTQFWVNPEWKFEPPSLTEDEFALHCEIGRRTIGQKDPVWDPKSFDDRAFYWAFRTDVDRLERAKQYLAFETPFD